MKTLQTNIRKNNVISSLRVERNSQHWHIHIWNRGVKAGTICVDAKDGTEVVRRLGASHPWVWEDYSEDKAE